MNFSSPKFFDRLVKEPDKISIHVEPREIADFSSFLAYIFEVNLPQCKIPLHNFEFPVGAGNTFHVSKYVVPKDLIPVRNVTDDGNPYSPPKHFIPGGTSVAIKRLRFSSLRSEEEGLHQDGIISNRLKAASLEIRCLTHPPILEHRNIVNLLAVGWEETNQPWPTLISEFAELGTLANLDAVTPARLTSILRDIACGLSALHGCHIIHGDIKAENVLIFRSSGTEVVAKLADFGCALIDLRGERFRVGGTEIWMAPECERSLEKEALALTDIYSYGLLVWWTTRYRGEDPLRVFRITDIATWKLYKVENRILGLALESFKTESRTIRLPLNDILLLCLQAEPQHRTSNMTTIVKLLSWENGSEEALGMLNTLEYKSGINNCYDSKNIPLAPFLADNVYAFGGDRLIEGSADVPLLNVDSRYEMLPEHIKSIICTEMHRIVSATTIRPLMDMRDINSEISGHRALYEQMKEVMQSPYFFHADTLRAAKAAFELSYAYFVGFSVPPSSKKAAEFMTISASLGLTKAIPIVKRFHEALGQEVPANVPIRLWLVLGILYGSLEAAESLRGLDASLYADAIGLVRLMPHWKTWFQSEKESADISNIYPLEDLGTLKRELKNRDEHVGDVWLIEEEKFGLLHLASAGGKLEAIEVLLTELGADVNQVTENQETPILLACRAGRHESIRCLLKFTPDLNIANSTNCTPLHWLVSVDDDYSAGLARSMVAQGANINFQSQTRWRSPFTYTQFHLNSSPLTWAFFRKKLSLFMELHSLGAKMLIDTPPLPEYKPIYGAWRIIIKRIIRDNLPVRPLEELHSLGARLITDAEQINPYAAPFLMAAALHMTDFVIALCNSSDFREGIVSPGELLSAAVRRKPDITMTRALMHGYKRKESELACISYLLEIGADPFTKFPLSPSVLLQAMCSGYRDVVEILLNSARQQGRELRLEDLDFFDGLTALQHSIALNDRSLFKLLIKFGAEVTGKSEDDVTCFHLACEMEDSYFAETLLDLGAYLSTVSTSGLTPFETAVRKGNLQTAASIIKHLGQSWSGLLTSHPPKSLTTFGRVLNKCWEVDSTSIQYLFDLEIANFIVNPSTNDSVFHVIGIDDFHMSCLPYSTNYCRVMDCLLAHYSTPEHLNARNKSSLTALHYMALFSNVSGVASLLDAGANVNAIDNCWRTPLDLVNEIEERPMPNWVEEGGIEAVKEWRSRTNKVLNMLLEKGGQKGEFFKEKVFAAGADKDEVISGMVTDGTMEANMVK